MREGLRYSENNTLRLSDCNSMIFYRYLFLSKRTVTAGSVASNNWQCYQTSHSYTSWCRVGFKRCGERRLARRKSPILTAQTTRPLQIAKNEHFFSVLLKWMCLDRVATYTINPNQEKGHMLIDFFNK